MDDILKSAWGDLLNENEKLAALLDEKAARIEQLEAALEPFARNVEAISLFATLGHITREDLLRARDALAGKEPQP